MCRKRKLCRHLDYKINRHLHTKSVQCSLNILKNILKLVSVFVLCICRMDKMNFIFQKVPSLWCFIQQYNRSELLKSNSTHRWFENLTKKLSFKCRLLNIISYLHRKILQNISNFCLFVLLSSDITKSFIILGVACI